MKNTAIIMAILVLSAIALASGSEHATHGAEGIPLDKIGWQAANLGALLVALFFFIRKSVVEVFENRKQNYVNQAAKTKESLLGAEAALAEIKQKLTNLESGEKQALERAQHEANLISANLITDAKATAEKIKKDVSLTIGNELNKAKSEINAAILNQALGAAAKNISNGAQPAAQAENSFLKQLEQVKA